MPETEMTIDGTHVIWGESAPDWFARADAASGQRPAGYDSSSICFVEAHAAPKQRKLLAYVSGPYRDARGEWFVQQNIREAEAVALELWRMGFAVICPHKNTERFGGACQCPDPEPWLAGDLVMVQRCDLIVMLPRWRESEGARAELQHATTSRVPAFFWPDNRRRLEAIGSGDQDFLASARKFMPASTTQCTPLS